MNQIGLISGAIYFIPLLISAKLDERWSGFGGMQYTSVCNPLMQCKMIWSELLHIYLGLIDLCEYSHKKNFKP
jgi:hypothetical protein